MEQNNPILDITETASEDNIEPTMQQLILSGEGIPVNISLKHLSTDCTAAQMGYIESEEKSLNVNCSHLDKLTSLMLPLQDEDILETPVQLEAAMYKPAELVPEVITHNANLNICDSKGRSPMRFADQVKSTFGKELTDILLNHVSLQVRQLEEGFDCSSDTEPPLSGSCIGWEQKICTNIDFSTCGSEVFSEDSENSLTNTATELASGSNSRNILLYFHTAKQTLQERIEVYKELEMSSQGISLGNSWKYPRPKERHSSLPDDILLTPGRLMRPSSLNITRRSSCITKVLGLEIGRQMQGSQSEPSITDPEIHLDSLPAMKTHIQQTLQNGNNETIKVALPQLNTNSVRSPVSVRLAPLQRKTARDISNTVLLSTPSKPSRLPALTTHISITKTKRMKIQALPQDHRSKDMCEYDSGGISGNSNSLDMVETSQRRVIQTSERRDDIDIENNCKLNLPPPKHVDESMGYVDTKCNNELHLIQENDKCSYSNHANHLVPTENRECISSGSDESKSKCKEPNTTEINLSNEEVVHTNCCKDIAVLLDSVQNEELNYQLSKRLYHVGEHVEGNALKSTARDPGQSTNLENICNKRAGNLVFLCRQEIHPSDDLFEADIAEDVITQNSRVQNLIENLGENITAPETIMGTDYVTYVKEENLAHKDVQTGSKGIPVIFGTLTNQPHSKLQKVSRQTPIKRRDNGYITARDTNHSFNVLAQNEKGAKKKIAKSNFVNSSSIAVRNKHAFKASQYISIPKQKGPKQNVHLQPNVRSVKSKQDPSLPLMENAGLNQISSKVQLKPQIKSLLKNGSVPKKSLPHINRSATSLSKPSVPPIPRSRSLANFSELKYCDMFQEIYSVDKGPGIYEMFGTPVYSILRESTALDSNDQGVHSAPPRKASMCKNLKSNKSTGKNSAKNINENLNSKNNTNCTNIQKKKVGISQTQEKISPLLNSAEEQGDIVIISGCDWHTKTSRSEAVIGKADSQEDSGHCPDFSEPYYPTDVCQIEKQNLSTITEASLEQVSVRTGESENIFQESDRNCVKEWEVEHSPINDSNDILLQKSNHMDSFATNLLELKNHPSKGDIEIIQTYKDLGCQNNTDASESTTLLPNELNLKIADDEAESATLCTFGNQNNATSSEGRVTADLDSNPASFPGQPLRNMWTAVSPSGWFECPSQEDLTSELLSCLASALLLEENDTNEQALQVVTNVQEKVNQKTVENFPLNENEGMVDFCRTEEKNEINIQNPEYFVTKLWSTPGPNSCLDNSIKSECSSISYDEAITWTKGNILGKGASGTVYCGLTSQGQLIAVKQVAPDTTNHITAEKEYQKLQEEVELLKNLNHINIVSFLGTSLEAKVVSIFMEFVPGGSIASVVNRFGPLPEAVFCMYTKQIVQGVDYLHDNRVIHRDIKGNNVMLMPNGIIKLIDFGCAKRLACVNMNGTYSEVLKSMHGTPYWMAPEVINETGYGRKSDIWSTGCTVFEMASGKPPLAHMDKIAAMFYIGAQRGPMPHLPEQFSENSRDFVQICLTSDQHKRPSVKQLLQHPFIVRQGSRDRTTQRRQNCSRQ